MTPRNAGRAALALLALAGVAFGTLWSSWPLLACAIAAASGLAYESTRLRTISSHAAEPEER